MSQDLPTPENTSPQAEPAHTAPAAPEAAPAAPQNAAPAAPQYAAPAAPAAPQYAAPAAPQYAAPAAPQYAAPAAPASPQYVAPVAAPGTNVLAIVGFVSAFFIPILPIVLGHISLSQIKRSGEQGRGFAIAALVLGYIELAALALVTIFVVIAIAAALSYMY